MIIAVTFRRHLQETAWKQAVSCCFFAELETLRKNSWQVSACVILPILIWQCRLLRMRREMGHSVKKALNIIKTVLVWLLVVVAVAMMIFTIVSVTTFNRNDRNLFGYRVYIVMSDSMAATDFDAGSLILVKETDPKTLQEGDIISYVSQSSESFGETVTHKIRKITSDANGNLAFVTYGTSTGIDDATLVTAPYILGKYELAIPYIGTFFSFLKTPQGYIVCILIPFMLLILYQGVNCVRLFRRYKREQLEEMNEEKARIEEERAQNARMMEELLALKAQLDQQSAEGRSATPLEGVSEDADS